MARVKAIIKNISPIHTDENGYTYVDLVLDNGVEGYYPNIENHLFTLSIGDKITYSNTSIFNNKLKINGLMKTAETTTKKVSSTENIQPATPDIYLSKILNVGEIKISSKKGGVTYYRDIELEDGNKATDFSSSYDDIFLLSPGALVSHKGVKDNGLFNELKIIKLSFDIRKDETILRQVAFKAAIDVLGSNFINYKSKDSFAEDVRSLTDKLLPIIKN